MANRQIVFGCMCLLVGILIGMEIATNIDALVRLVIFVVILLLLAYLLLPFIQRRTTTRRAPAHRAYRKRTRPRP